MVFSNQRETSRRILLCEISRRGRVARIDLAAATGISRATVTTITADLLRDGLIKEVHPEPTPGTIRGRPRIDLKIDGSAHLIAGLKVGGGHISSVLIDFEGTQLAEYEATITSGPQTPQVLSRQIATVIDRLSAKVGARPVDLSGIGVGLAGTIDAAAGSVHWSPSLGDRNVPFADLLTSDIGVPAYLDNDANLVAVAEKTWGLGRGLDNFIVVIIGSGVGMGVVIGGEIYRGIRGCGAEFGHTKVHLDGALCRCGQRGCLEAYVADYALVREAEGALCPANADQDPIDRLMTAVRTGDAAAVSILDRAGRMFAMGLANLVNILDPERIILAGEQVRFDHLYADAVLEEMRNSVVQIDAAPPEVVVHKWGDLMFARGAAAYALDFVLDRAAREAREPVHND